MKSCRMLLGISAAAAFAAASFSDCSMAQERWHRRQPRLPAAQVRPPPAPMLAVVGLREQRLTVYDSTGARMLESPVSSGNVGYETPPGVFSIVQKELEHHSNLYDDASMPYMQRLTWTGIALHAGALPGYPASHGCVRLPHDFAERFYDLTKVGMRVVVAREGMAPVPIAEPAIFKRNSTAMRALGLAGPRPAAIGAELPKTAPSQLEAHVTRLTNAAEEASERVHDARMAAARAKAALKPAARDLRLAEAALAKAEGELQEAEKTLAEGGPEKRLADAEKLKAAALPRIEAARAKLEKMQRESDDKLEASRLAGEKLHAEEAAHSKAVEAMEQAKQSMAPVSVFISRKTQRIYVRKAFQPLWEAPVIISDADKPIGTFVFTANEPAEGQQDLRWSVVSLYRNPTQIEPAAPRGKPSGRLASVELPPTDATAAAAALDRLHVPEEIADRISETVLAGSSLIISDEPPNLETGKDTDFVVIMSGEPQGGIAIRQRPKPDRFLVEDDEWGNGSRRPRRWGGGGFGFWFD